MKSAVLSLLTASLLALPALVSAQLSGRVGPTTSTASKAAKKLCNILDYGGVASATADNGAAILAAWKACISGGEVYIPSGSYGLGTWVTLTGGTGVSINLEGTIYRTGTAGGNMIFIEHTTDFEFYSGNSKGAIQGYGYVFHSAGTYGPRILRLFQVTSFSVHDIVLVDSPAFHLSLDTCTDGELYNLVIRGGNRGGLDGVDIWGTNIWAHDIEVTNKDECVTVKSPASYILVENIYCNWSGGSAIGSLGANTAISNVYYNHIYSQNCNQMMLIKSNGGSGTFSGATFNNFMGHSNAYTLDIDTAWSGQSVVAGNGVAYSDLTFSHWHGTCLNGAARAPIQLLCPSATFCKDITISSFYIWTEAGKYVLYKCKNAYGTGPCLRGGTNYTTYTSTQTVTSLPTASYAYTKMPGEISTGLGLTESIPIPTHPASYYPGIAPYSTLLG
ncbi:hypothetical protein DSL72_004766 [Monilinia vaccinii-corymbosi]|uniref:Pectate lyase superfamily protein domain-containing protein n=1 Tax=Monilinia vaccinii-corymbosi TaxID=61207 RepID=A0A8A3P312_9HELO|nr:hypothetical protein DSL72_004766 [Monilinia vaccinii-corymbosi]